MPDVNSSLLPSHIAITGATGGLGQALAKHYAASGRVLSLSGRDAERLDQIGAVCRDKGAQVHTQRVDVTDADATEAWLLGRDSDHPIDMVITSSGMGGAAVISPPTGEPGRLARDILMTNAFGVINAVTPILPRMIERRRGHLVLIGSIQAMIGLPQSPVYCASKAAVQIYGDGLRRLVRRHGVRVTTVLPGFIDTPMSRSLAMDRPWCWPADKAAGRIARDVARGAARSIFPWQLSLLIGLQNGLPVSMTDFIMARIARSFPVTH
jgi:short-subunit dehydrogenase